MFRPILATAILALTLVSGCGEPRQTVFTPPSKSAEPAVERKLTGDIIEPHGIPMH